MDSSVAAVVHSMVPVVEDSNTVVVADIEGNTVVAVVVA